MEMASRRLSDAEIRTKHIDQILDAVIGLEVILLATAGSADYRGEMRYRFSLNYATLFDTSDSRLSAFKCARDIYDLRSRIAHTGSLDPGPIKIGKESYNQKDAATKCCEMLRHVVHKYLPFGKIQPYLKSDYWPARLFGHNWNDEPDPPSKQNPKD